MQALCSLPGDGEEIDPDEAMRVYLEARRDALLQELDALERYLGHEPRTSVYRSYGKKRKEEVLKLEYHP